MQHCFLSCGWDIYYEEVHKIIIHIYNLNLFTYIITEEENNYVFAGLFGLIQKGKVKFQQTRFLVLIDLCDLRF